MADDMNKMGAPLIFERSKPGARTQMLPPLDVPESLPDPCALRRCAPPLPELAEGEVSRHFSLLERRAFGVNNGFYPLGSCTMKYNPKLNDEMAALPGFADIHPLQPEHTVQGCLEALSRLDVILREITGMDAVSLQPAAGAQGEFTGVMMIKAYHESRGEGSIRTKMLIPDSAHGTNPASAAMNNYTVVTIPSDENGCVDINALRASAGSDTAGLMLTNPNTLGLYEPNVAELTRIVHDAGGLCYYDGANLNAIMGRARPGDMGFDAAHLNLHKTFAAPHGGGGPGGAAVCCKAFLSEYLPSPIVTNDNGAFTLDCGGSSSIGSIHAFYGNFLVCLKALCYLLSLGRDGVTLASSNAVLNANYLMRKLTAPDNAILLDGKPPRACMHEFVLSLKKLKSATGVSALDVAKGLLDEGMHPPTMYFPLIVDEALMFEPTETESRDELDAAAQKITALLNRAFTDPESLRSAPRSTPVRRPDEVKAARSPTLRYGCRTAQ
ncbi:MAG: aminomethyl-transferring glycine dehydrogenase subunit GcvPB [Oscillospiraceae bacterium]|jgi:glycine dehydrogenase subunit 2|nr:aminomethyl-transferring glycine dehydrogenase subunit GcvPB [Oscillospiraceae bacterium]